MSQSKNDDAEGLAFIAGELDREWSGFADLVMPAGVPDAQRVEMRLAFASGWFAALNRLMHLAGEPGATAADVAAAVGFFHAAACESMRAEQAALEARGRWPRG